MQKKNSIYNVKMNNNPGEHLPSLNHCTHLIITLIHAEDQELSPCLLTASHLLRRDTPTSWAVQRACCMLVLFRLQTSSSSSNTASHSALGSVPLPVHMFKRGWPRPLASEGAHESGLAKKKTVLSGQSDDSGVGMRPQQVLSDSMNITFRPLAASTEMGTLFPV